MHPFFAFGIPHGGDWIWILVIILLLFGGAKLPQLARGLGKSLGEFKKAKDEFEKEVRSAAVSEENKPLADKTGVTPSPTATPLSSVPAAGADESAKKI